MTCRPGATLYSTLIAGATNLIRLIGLVDESTGLYPIDGVVTGTIFDAAGVAIAGAEDLPLILDGTTTGADTEYRATVAASVPLVAGVYVLVKVRAIVSAAERTFEKRVLVLAP